MKAIGLFSGGLDSALSAKIISLMGIEVTAVYFCQPWQEADLKKIQAVADGVGVHFKVIDLGQDYVDMIMSPEHGYGKGLNPCIDCHRMMICKAAELMKEIGAAFVFTGEVVGQRPMSQRKACLPLVERGTGIEGYVLRPLSAKLLEPTIPEQNGWVDREKLFNISGRGRREQMDLADQLGIREYLPTGGGCLVTDPHFGACLKDFLSWNYRDPKESAVLKWGRYFRLNELFIAIVGRDQRENSLLVQHAHPQDVIVRMAEAQGPVVLLKGTDPDEKIFGLAGGLAQQFSKSRDLPPQRVEHFSVSHEGRPQYIKALKIDEKDMQTMER